MISERDRATDQSALAVERGPTGVIKRQPTLKLLSVELAVVDGPDRGKHVRLARGRARIGSAAGNDLVLSDATVSRLHCELEVGPERVRVIDRGSTNGTYVGSLRVRDAEILAGTDVKLGNTTVSVQLGKGPTFLELSLDDRLGGLLGSSVAMRRIYALIKRAAPTDTTVLVLGATGSGKELVARTVHEHSQRAAGPFVAVDCGAIVEGLFESELFGHVRGAFSGAVSDRVGVLAAARGGTVLLDEIGELPLNMQPKLLRVLETREVRPVGGNEPRPIDVRVIAATNQPLAHRVNDGSFREDLYYRLAVVELELPALCDRREDIDVLAQRFFERFSGEDEPIPPELLRQLRARSWPGNVRELRNAVERAVLLGWGRSEGGPASVPAHTLTSVEARVATKLPLKDARAAWEEQFDAVYLRALLEETGGNVSRAAERAGINRRSLQRLMIRRGLRVSPDE